MWHPAARNKQHPPTATPNDLLWASTRHSTIVIRQPTTKTATGNQSKRNKKPTTDRGQTNCASSLILTDIHETGTNVTVFAKVSAKITFSFLSLVTYLKPTTTERQLHNIYLVDNVTLSVTCRQGYLTLDNRLPIKSIDRFVVKYVK
jgi:hypothetical protein